IVKFRSTVAGVDVFREQVAVSMDQQFNLIAVSGFVTGTASGVNRTFALTPSQAISRAISDLLDIQVSDASLVRSGGQGPYEHYSAAPGVSAFHFIDQARAKKVFYRLPGRLDAAYYVEVSVARPGDHDSKAYSYVISAADGQMLFRMNQTASDNFGYRAWADTAAGGLRLPFDGPQGNSPTPKANPVPDGSVPPFIAPNFLTLQSGPISTGDPWLAPGATFTLGNNVEAFADLASPDDYQPGTADTYAYTTSAGNFDHLYDLNMAAGSSAEQTQAGVTQLFYNVNMFHDWYYDAGFKEVDGNAQKSNYGRGGLENDSIFAEDLDFAGRNNANMATPADGARPRMRMYVWDGPQTSTISATGGVTGSFPNGTADFGPSNFNVTAPLLRTSPIDACNPVTNNLTGKIAFVDRGTCSFVIKTKNAQLAGASAVIIANVASSTNPEIPPGMTGVDATVTVGTLSLALTDGNTFRTALDASVAVTATLNRVTGLSRDGALDNQIVAHEWGHYISNRLVQDASGLNTNMASGLGEGWADFHAMLLTVKAEDTAVASNSTWNGVYAMAGYATNDFYFGIRRVPYSSDFTKNPLTFKHISEGVALPPGVPYAFGQDGVGNSEAHNTGEVWASMLWECYASLLRDTQGPTPRISFAEARSRMKKYIVEGYKMTPTSPTLLDARDAVLAAAFATSKTDYQLFAQAFARRGAGTAAVAPDRFSSTNSPGLVESYEVGGALTLLSTSLDDTLRTCSADGILDNGEAGQFLLTIKNTGARPLVGTVASITSTNPNVRFPYGNVFRMPNSNPFDEVTGGLVVGLQGATAIGQADFSITVSDPRLLTGTPATATLSTYVNADSGTGFTTDTVESPVSTWLPQAAIGSGLFARVQTSTTPLNYAWNGPDSGSLADRSLISPNLSVGAGNFSFSISHRYSFEFDASARYDGGVIEITTDGVTWTNIGTGYNGTISNCCSNPLTGRSAYTAASSGYPSFVTQNISLGTTYANQIVKIRFRIGEDEAGGAPGWDVDNITFVGLKNKPFTGLVADPGCPATTSSN
ncbi:MAG: M36 family metallopeptidase, partial [Bryobacteraceae bacterium]